MPEAFNEQLAEQVDHYIERLFVHPDESLTQNLKDAAAAGLPTINISPTEGKLLYLIAKMSRAKRILEIGTLGGYSTTWLARALPVDGKLVTLELDPKHATVARRSLERAGVNDRVEIRVGRAVDSLRTMIDHVEAPFDLIFIDADKPSYPDYLTLAMQLTRPGTIILADNLIRNGRVLNAQSTDESARGARAYNAAIAAHPRLESIVLPIIREHLDGLSISIVR
ncbi:MAG TPA: O-methyltransferase [Anaerolineae bacterium]|jgi:caffeoyl-CoA O-methyltransferase|nr:O-methyltransferase [Anaerolineae bacterium]